MAAMLVYVAALVDLACQSAASVRHCRISLPKGNGRGICHLLLGLE